jgi:hypothetical protein
MSDGRGQAEARRWEREKERHKAGTKAGMFKKTKEISECDRPIKDLEKRTTRLRFRRAEDECGTMNDEARAETRSRKQGARRKKQVGLGAKPES